MDMFSIDIPCLDDEIIRSNDILYIILIYINKAPKIEIHTKDQIQYSKIFGPIEALEILFSQFGFVRVDSGTLANLNHFSRFEKNLFGDVYLHFINSEKKAYCSRPGHRRTKKILDNRSPS